MCDWGHLLALLNLNGIGRIDYCTEIVPALMPLLYRAGWSGSGAAALKRGRALVAETFIDGESNGCAAGAGPEPAT